MKRHGVEAGGTWGLGGGYLFAYFRQIYGNRVETTPEGIVVVKLSDHGESYSEESLHYAVSDDGIRWRALNGNRPVFVPPAGGGTLRDPFLDRGLDGKFRLMGTRGGMGRESRTAWYWESSDLREWPERRALPLVEKHPELFNIWAPEWVFDEGRGEYLVYWSSSWGTEGWDDSRIWCAWTKDFKTFGPARVLLDPGYTVIDGSILFRNGWWWMAFKDERFGHKHGEHRFIKLARAKDLDGPWEVVTKEVTAQLTEGPLLYPAPDGDGVLMAYDYCMANGYGVSRSRDMLNWEVVKEGSFPPDARHGSVIAITADERAALEKAFG